MPATRAAFEDMYYSMNTDELGGTTSTNFKNGLESFVEEAGYDFSYSSFYESQKTVDLDKLKTAISQNKVVALFCSTYNYVYSIREIEDLSLMQVIKTDSTIPHMMMAYGYMTIEYYRNSVNFRTDTFLYVTSSDSTARLGYMQLDDFLTIDEALILTVS